MTLALAPLTLLMLRPILTLAWVHPQLSAILELSPLTLVRGWLLRAILARFYAESIVFLARLSLDLRVGSLRHGGKLALADLTLATPTLNLTLLSLLARTLTIDCSGIQLTRGESNLRRRKRPVDGSAPVRRIAPGQEGRSWGG